LFVFYAYNARPVEWVDLISVALSNHQSVLRVYRDLDASFVLGLHHALAHQPFDTLLARWEAAQVVT